MGMAAALASGDTGETERLLDEADTLLQRVGPWSWSLAAYIRAVLALRRGNPDEAIARVRESLIRMRELHDNFAFVYALIPLAAAAVLKGDDTLGGPGSWAFATPSPNGPAPRQSTSR